MVKSSSKSRTLPATLLVVMSWVAKEVFHEGMRACFVAGRGWHSVGEPFLACGLRPSQRADPHSEGRTVVARCAEGVTEGQQAVKIFPTSVPGIYGIPGGNWGTEDSVNGTWGYYVPQGGSMRKVDTSHVSGDLEECIRSLPPELALPWGFMLEHGDGSVSLIDVPYYSADLVVKLKEMAPKGVRYILFTHSDFIGMAEPGEWKRSFTSVTRVAHKADAQGADEMEVLFEGSGTWRAGDFRIDAAPGHTEGSLIISSETHNTSFGGDSMGYWDGEATGYAKMARFSCKVQAKSIRKFADEAPFYRFWFPGHGLPMEFESREDRKEQLYAAAEGLENASAFVSAP